MPKKPKTKAKTTKTGTRKKRTNKNIVTGESMGGLSGPDNQVIGYKTPTHPRVSLTGELDYKKLVTQISGLITNQQKTRASLVPPPIEKMPLIEKDDPEPT